MSRQMIFRTIVLVGLSLCSAMGSDDPRPLPLTGVNLAGGEFWLAGKPKEGARPKYGVNYSYPTREEIDYFSGKGMNVFRYQFLWETLQPVLRTPLDKADLERLKTSVSYATSRKLVVVLDPHNYARYYGTNVVGGANVSAADFADFWQRLASEFKDEPYVWFGLVNEPHDMPTQQWFEAANACIAAIRGTGARNLILVPGNSWSGAHSWTAGGEKSNAKHILAVNDPLDYWAIEVHQYLDADSSGTHRAVVSPTIGSERLQKFVDWCRQHQKFAVLGEFGVPVAPNGQEALRDMLLSMERDRDVWLGWTWWAAGARWGEYMFTLEPKGGVDRPQMTWLQPHLHGTVPAKFHVVVKNGIGGGELPACSVQSVVAETPVAGAVFKEWTGDVSWLQDRYAARTTLTVPFKNIQIEAVFEKGTASATVDKAKYCNSVQNRTGFIRYPLGTIGVWSTGTGESADVITRAPRVYPCVNVPVAKVERDDWRASVTGDPSKLEIRYKEDKPSGASSMEITVSPHVSVFKAAFPAEAKGGKYLVFDFRKVTVDSWARLYKWTDRTITRVDDRTFQATVGEPGKSGAHYVVRFSAPCVASGFLESTNRDAFATTNAAGGGPCLYAQFDTPEVTVAIAESFTSLKQAGAFLATEFTDFEGVHQRCRSAWNEVLNHVELDGSEVSKRMAYTALYTVYVNVIDGSDGSYYAAACKRPLSIASSAYWQFVGGYQSCCWDNVRATYPFMILAFPEVMADVVNTYLARYQRDGCMDGDSCLFAGPSGHNNIRLVPVLMAQALGGGIAADYSRIYSALKDNYSNPAYVQPSLSALGHLTQPESGGFACSRTLEFSDGLSAMGLLARLNGDWAGAKVYSAWSDCYTNLWDSTNRVFRVRSANGSWGPLENSKMTWNPNPQGLFEGSTRDWMFAVPHDPYGLMSLPGQAEVAERLIAYCTNDAWFNDYQCIYPYMLYYAGRPNEAQRIIRRSWVPLFEQAVMYEGVRPKPPHNGWQTHYTGNSGWLICSMLGLYPVVAPAGQYVISSPSVNGVAIHSGKADLSVRALGNSGENIYIRSIKIDGRPYPCYLIPARRLAAGARIELEMGGDPAQGLGDLYVGSSDGLILSAELVSPDRLECKVESAITDATTKIVSRTRPARITVNGKEDRTWSYEPAARTSTLRTAGTAIIEVFLR